MNIYWDTEPAIASIPAIGGTAIVCFGNTEIEVNAGYMSSWSEFFRAYFQSDMKEARSGKFPIEDCSIEDFHEILSVIHPCGKIVDAENVERLLELARRFMMPFLAHHCEVFLLNKDSHKFSIVKLFQIAHNFDLTLFFELLVDGFATTAELRKMIKSAEYKALPDELKKRIEARYMDIDLRAHP
ncbi:hypothetical protein PFISCL1PPCAC_26014 [Pristionchus fissidentatus]|uniref:BTB domain-containing protein n=1 Tax=Pristionchus fissidentatus TaxID=1538716 RepID=A0AAV5WRS2_9BILA|nr:hypothetical protein PFISCL1PPCAC_26014 [Pristionchus fissidentatus]